MIASLWHNNKAIISLNDQTNIEGPLAWVKSTCLTGIQGIKLSNYVLKGLDFMFGIWNAQDSE